MPDDDMLLSINPKLCELIEYCQNTLDMERGLAIMLAKNMFSLIPREYRNPPIEPEFKEEKY